MGRKVHPLGFRLGIIKEWQSRWFADRNYTELLHEDIRLRALINKRLGYRNFNALLHEYRLRDACAWLADPTKAHLPILTIALEVGYQSIAPFNQAFREAKGCTPSVYRRQHTKPS